MGVIFGHGGHSTEIPHITKKEKNNVCEWCKMGYPKGCYDYYFLEVFGEVHIICKDCYRRLRKLKFIKD